MPGYIGRTEIQIAGGAISRNVFVGNGATTSFGPLDQTPFNEEETVVTINGVVQHDSSYAVVVDYVNFAVAPANLDEIEVKVFSTERRPAEGVRVEEVQLENLSTLDIIGDDSKLYPSLVPQMDVIFVGGTVTFNTTNRSTFLNKKLMMTAATNVLELDQNTGGDYIELITHGPTVAAIAVKNIMAVSVVSLIDGNGTVTDLSAQNAEYIIPSSNAMVKITYKTSTHVIIETTYAPVISGGWNLVDFITLSSSDSWDVALSPGAYDKYKLEYINLRPTSGGAHLALRVRNGGVQDSSSNYRWVNNEMNANGGANTVLASGATSVSEVFFKTALNSANDFSSTIYFNDPTIVTDKINFHGTYSAINAAAQYVGGNIHAWYTQTTVVSSLILFMSTGGMQSGKIKLFGQN